MGVKQALVVLAVIVGSVILHELSHGVVAYLLGDRTAKEAGRLTINPLKHIDPVMSIIVPMLLYFFKAPVFGGAKPVPVDFRRLKWGAIGMALVALAGPLMNLLIAFISFLIGHFTGFLYGVGGNTVGFLFQELIFVNLGFTLFNLIPIPPLDGSRVLYAVSPDAVRNFLDIVERYGFIVVYVLVFLFGDSLSELMIQGTNGMLGIFYFIVGG